ncbi:MAG: tetratricopeptide repeat protein, partial [Alphaproteobacteria bacterium]|nr:tetratricopeptide repeat protein [Alphaproteobacteria bacterium]
MLNSHKIYSHDLTKINDIAFSRREIEVISFLISGRSAKKIASILNISPKTVEFHCARIMQKLSCNSRESIIDFVEKSPQYHTLKTYHTRLIAEILFEDLLKKLPEPSETETAVYVWTSKDHLEELAHLKKHLKSAKFKLTSVNVGEAGSQLQSLFQNKEGTLLKIEGVNATTNNEISTLFLDESALPPDALKNICYNTLIVETVHFDDYFTLFLSVLKVFFSKSLLNSLFGDFVKHHLSHKNQNHTKHQERRFSASLRFSSQLRKTFSKNSSCAILIGMLILGCVTSLLLVNFWKNIPTNAAAPTRLISELYLPPEDHLLKRQKLLLKIKESFNAPNKIQTTLLQGIGGSGKTTLARQFARSSSSEIIWEINAETKDTLIKSFERFARAIYNSESDVKALAELDELKRDEFREEKLMTFIKEKLRHHPNWFLIFDNIENFPALQNYIPNDKDAWGVGCVLLTSRDRNIQMNSIVQHTVEIGELNESERLSLFLTMSGKKSLSNSEEKMRLLKFLEEVPPYPLDISLAAKYLMTANISYEQYVKNLSESKADFIDLQNSILVDSGSYKINRLHIVALTLDKLLKENEGFADLLLFISLINSQNIPRELLTHHQNSVAVDNFIYQAKKSSLVSEDETLASSPQSTLSMHRTIQKISLAYLKKKIPPQEVQGHILEISNTLNTYLSQEIEKEYAPTLIPLTAICESFLENGEVIPVPMMNSLKIGLGWTYGYLGDYGRAKQLLEHTLKDLEGNDSQDLLLTSRALAYLGNIYREIGDFKGALKFLKDSQTILLNHFSQKGSDLGFVYANLGYIQNNLGNNDQAKGLLEEALHLYRTHVPDNHLGIARALGYLGYVHKGLGNYARALELLEESQDYYTKHSPDNRDLVRVLMELGSIYKELGYLEKSKTLLEESLHLYKRHLPLNHTNVAWVLGRLGGAYLELNEMSKAKDALEKNLKGYSEDGEDNQENITKIFIDLSHPILTNQFPAKQKNTERTGSYLGYNYRSLGDYVKAKDILEKGLQTYKMHFPQNHIGIARDLSLLGCVHKELGNYTKAVALLEESKKYYKQYFPDHFMELVSVIIGLGTSYKEL